MSAPIVSCDSCQHHFPVWKLRLSAKCTSTYVDYGISTSFLDLCLDFDLDLFFKCNKFSKFYDFCRYELEFFINVVNGNGIISWAAIDTNRANGQSNELIGFVTARVVAAEESEVSPVYEFMSSKRHTVQTFIFSRVSGF
jgi:hypothetical protein